MGVAAVLEKNFLKLEHATAFSSALSPIVVLLSLVFFPWANFNVTALQLALLFLFGALNAYAFLLSARVFKHGELSIASAAFSSLPTLFVVLLAFVFLSERLVVVQYISIIGMIVATYMLLFRPEKRKGRRPAFDGNKYRYMILGYAFLFAVCTILSRYLLLGIDPYAFLILTGVFTSLCLAVFITIRYGGTAEIIKTVKRYRLQLFSIELLTLGYRITFYVALAIAPVSLIQSLRNTLYVIMAVVLGGYLFGEEGTARKLVLSLMLVFFAYLLTL
jgi:uncharacterized membrane protein